LHKIKVAIAGVGNCASALIQGLQYYSKKGPAEGLTYWELGGYTPKDIEFVAAFDVNTRKVGKDLSQAIFQPPRPVAGPPDPPPTFPPGLRRKSGAVPISASAGATSSTLRPRACSLRRLRFSRKRADSRALRAAHFSALPGLIMANLKARGRRRRNHAQGRRACADSPYMAMIAAVFQRVYFRPDAAVAQW
jgi:hypothetical protein